MTLNEAKQILEENGLRIDELSSAPFIGMRNRSSNLSGSNWKSDRHDLEANKAIDAIDNLKNQVEKYTKDNELDGDRSKKTTTTMLKPFKASFEQFIEISKTDPKYFAGILGIDGCFTHYSLNNVITILKKIKNHPELFTKRPSFMQKTKFKLLKNQVKESINYLQEHGYIITEGRYNEYSDIGMNPGWDDSADGQYIAEVEWINTEELKNTSKQVFGNDTFLYDLMTSFDIPNKVVFEYNERRDEDSDFEWSDPDTANWFIGQEKELLEAIYDNAQADGIKYNVNYVNNHITEICELLQKTVDSCIDNYIYKTRKPV